MTGRWQDSWTFRIVDQDSGASVSGVPVAVLDEGGRSAGVWVSDVDGTVRIPKHDRPRLRLRVGLHNDEVIELDARSLPDEPVPIVAPRGEEVAQPLPSHPIAVPEHGAGHLLRFARIGVLRQDADVTETAAADRARFVAPADDPGVIRYGVVFEIEQVWQSLGSRAGDLLYSVSLGPGEEVKVAVQDGRWRKKPDARERPLQIVAKMVAARLVGDGLDVTPLEPFVVPDLAGAAMDTVRFLDHRTVRATEALRHRPLGVTPLESERPGGATVRSVRNMRPDGVLTYHFIEPVVRAQHAPRRRAHLPLHRARRVLPGGGAHAAPAASDPGAVPAAEYRDPRRGTPFRARAAAGAARPRLPARHRAGARGGRAAGSYRAAAVRAHHGASSLLLRPAHRRGGPPPTLLCAPPTAPRRGPGAERRDRERGGGPGGELRRVPV